MMPSTDNVTSDNNTPRNDSGEKYHRVWVSPKTLQKTAKIEG